MSTSEQDQRFLDKSVELQFLKPADVTALLTESVSDSGTIATRAIRRGMITTELVDIVESLLNPRDTAPGYELLEMVGRGGMGVVYRARQADLDRIVAIKTILLSSMSNPNVAKRFEREAMAVARLQHPNIIQAWNYGHHNGRYFLAMEFVPGNTCDQLISGGKRLSPRTAWSFVRQTASGLSHAHRHEVIHRDIKPANLMVMPPPEGTSLPPGVDMIKIADFGLAILSDNNEEQSRITSGNAIVGSPAYMSPEQFVGESIDYRSDIYSLGATAFNLLTSRTPFRGKSIGQLVSLKQRGITADHEELAGLPPEHVRLLIQMLAADPNDRPQSYSQLIDAIDSLPLQDTPHSFLSNTSFIEADEDSIVASKRISDAETQSSNAETQSSGTETQFIGTGSWLGNWFNHRPARKWIVPIAALLIALAIAGSSVFTRQVGPGSRDFKNVVSVQPLFDGITLAGWDVGGTMIGQWNVTRAPDGSDAMGCFSPRGAITRRLPEWPHLRATLFVYLATDDAKVDIDFSLIAGRTDSPRGCIRITTKSVVVGTKDMDFGDLKVRSQIAAPDTIESRYHVVDIERQETDWFVFFEQKYIGSIPIDKVAGGNAIRFITTGVNEAEPTVYFADVQASELMPPPRGQKELQSAPPA